MAKDTITVKNVPPALLEEAKIAAIREKRNLSDVVREMLREYVAEQSQKLKNQPTPTK